MSLSTQTRPEPGSELRRVQMLIDGEWVDSASGAVLTVENPARRSPVASIPRGDKEDVDRAVQAAHRAFPD
jgi:acyl-CoA reductase-like NAD-dependent aldehyde dehydrogenase